MSRFLPDGERFSSGERLVRLLALMLVFAAVVWAFWKQNERIISRMEERQSVADLGGYLNDEQRSFVKGFRDALKSRYGMEFHLRIVDDRPLDLPESDAKTMVMGLAPQRGELVLRLPPLLSSALGQEFLADLRANHLDTFWDDPDWQPRLLLVLAAIWERLDTIHGRKGDS